MTLQNLSKILDKYEEQLGYSNKEQFEHLRNLPFYNWESCSLKRANQAQIETNSSQTETFNHVIGLPQKNGKAYPLFDYEQILFDVLQTNKHLWIKKATGLGITEFILRYMTWLCLRDNTLSGKQMCIVTGPRIELAITLIDRMKGLFLPRLGLTFDTKETVIELNGNHTCT